MSILQRTALILVCILISASSNECNGQSMRPEKGLYDFELTWTMNASLDVNSENPMGWVKFNVTITNTGMMPDEYSIDASCSSGWPTIISPQTVPIGTNTVILPGSSFNINITVVDPMPSIPGAVCDLKVIGQSNHSPQKITKEKDTRLVIHCPLLSVRYISISPPGPIAGQSTTITATLMNAGDLYEPKANVSFFIDGRPIAMNVSAGRMEPGEIKNITVKWTALKGSHTIEAQTEHWFADYKNQSQDVKIEVKTESSTTKIGFELGIMSLIGIILVIALIIYRRRKGLSRN